VKRAIFVPRLAYDPVVAVGTCLVAAVDVGYVVVGAVNAAGLLGL
jgi:hypothetical protein